MSDVCDIIVGKNANIIDCIYTYLGSLDVTATNRIVSSYSVFTPKEPRQEKSCKDKPEQWNSMEYTPMQKNSHLKLPQMFN